MFGLGPKAFLALSSCHRKQLRRRKYYMKPKFNLSGSASSHSRINLSSLIKTRNVMVQFSLSLGWVCFDLKQHPPTFFCCFLPPTTTTRTIHPRWREILQLPFKNTKKGRQAKKNKHPDIRTKIKSNWKTTSSHDKSALKIAMMPSKNPLSVLLSTFPSPMTVYVSVYVRVYMHGMIQTIGNTYL